MTHLKPLISQIFFRIHLVMDSHFDHCLLLKEASLTKALSSTHPMSMSISLNQTKSWHGEGEVDTKSYL